jgi:hypothetical protein
VTCDVKGKRRNGEGEKQATELPREVAFPNGVLERGIVGRPLRLPPKIGKRSACPTTGGRGRLDTARRLQVQDASLFRRLNGGYRTLDVLFGHLVRLNFGGAFQGGKIRLGLGTVGLNGPDKRSPA